MNMSEKELENFIFDDLINNQGNELFNRGLELPFRKTEATTVRWFRQLNIAPYGICDIVGFYRSFGYINVDLLELKIVEIDANHFEQISRYVKGISVYLKNTFPNYQIIINPILIGSDYHGIYIQNYTNIDVSSFKYDLTGLSFSYHNGFSTWHIPDGKSKSFRNSNKPNGKAIN